jgi:hypothetical protein
MQNSTKLSPAPLACLTMIFFCANYGSMYAQGERKAFEEGDKILTFGLSGAGSGGYGINYYNLQSALRPTITFDYGLKGTNGIVSIGGFASYSSSKSSSFSNIYANYPNPYLGFGFPKDSIYAISQGGGATNQTFTVGVRLGLHYSTRKWDLYAGALLGYQYSSTQTNDYSMEYYKGFPTSNSLPIRTEEGKGQNLSSKQFILSPYVGARYYITPKISLNVEVGQHTGHAGIGFKF